MVRFIEVRPLVKELRFGKYEFVRKPPVIINLRHLRIVEETEERCIIRRNGHEEPTRLYSLNCGFSPFYYIDQYEYAALRLALFVEGGRDE